MTDIPIVNQLIKLAGRRNLPADHEVRGCARDIEKAVEAFDADPCDENMKTMVGLWARARRLYWENDNGPTGTAA